jgi:hypothetical protein
MFIVRCAISLRKTFHNSRLIKKLPELIEVMTTHFAQRRPVRYFCSDESHWGLKTLSGRVITAMGMKPVMCVQWPRDKFWLYGAVEPWSGEIMDEPKYHVLNLCATNFILARKNTSRLSSCE